MCTARNACARRVYIQSARHFKRQCTARNACARRVDIEPPVTSKGSVSTTKTNRSVLFKEKTAVCANSGTKNTLYGRNSGVFKVRQCGTHSYPVVQNYLCQPHVSPPIACLSCTLPSAFLSHLPNIMYSRLPLLLLF